MTVSVAQQGRGLCQALLLGGGFGALYDLFRVLRARLPGVGAALDLLFWLAATAGLFLWSQTAWGGQIRLYGALFCLLGGGRRADADFPHFGRPGGMGLRRFEKNSKICEKSLFFRGKMV